VRPPLVPRLAATGAVVVAVALLGACPLPQPLPGVGNIDAGLPITPPRVVTSTARPAEALTGYGPPAACAGGARFEVDADVIDETIDELVEVRWFVDYDPANQRLSQPLQVEVLLPPPDPKQYLRQPRPFPFLPSDFDLPASRLHVVEMAVSNGFLPLGQSVPDGGLPNREPAPGYEVQVFRWTFQELAGGGCGP